MKRIKEYWEIDFVMPIVLTIIIASMLIFLSFALSTGAFQDSEPEYSTEIAYTNSMQMVTAPDGSSCIVLVMYDPFSGGIGVGIDCHD